MFDFFGLPRELRDRCYEEMLVPQIGLPNAAEREGQKRYLAWLSDSGLESNGNSGSDVNSKDTDEGFPRQLKADAKPRAYATVQVKKAPDARLLLVSGRFMDEYLSTATRAMVLSIHYLAQWSPRRLCLPKIMCTLRTMTVKFWIECTCTDLPNGNSRRQPSVKRYFERAQDLMFDLLGQLRKPRVSIGVRIISAKYLHLGFCNKCAQCVLEYQRLLTRTVGLTSMRVRMRSRLTHRTMVAFQYDLERRELVEVHSVESDGTYIEESVSELDQQGERGPVRKPGVWIASGTQVRSKCHGTPFNQYGECNCSQMEPTEMTVQSRAVHRKNIAVAGGVWQSAFPGLIKSLTGLQVSVCNLMDVERHVNARAFPPTLSLVLSSPARRCLNFAPQDARTYLC